MNMSRNELRRKKRWGIPEDVEALNPGVDDDPVEDIITRQRQDRLNSALQKLPPKQKAVLTLRIHNEMSFAEIASVTGTSENSAKVNFHYAVRRLQELVTAEGH
jgi:RNA polymerase sigma-70 factor (ECF subfamily)